jgi:hypothetical protein
VEKPTTLPTTYHCAKGLTLRTKAGTRRAKVLMNGMSTVNGAAQAMNFMFGRQPQSGELGGINIKSLIFEDIDFDCPLAKNYGDGSVQETISSICTPMVCGNTSII